MTSRFFRPPPSDPPKPEPTLYELLNPPLSANPTTQELFIYVNWTANQAHFPPLDEFVAAIGQRMKTGLDEAGLGVPTQAISKAFGTILGTLIHQERLTVGARPLTDIAGGLIAEGRFRDYLYSLIPKYTDAPHTVAVISECFVRQFLGFVSQLPPVAFADHREGAQVPLLDVLTDVPEIVDQLLVPFFSKDVRELKLFADMREQLMKNIPTEKSGEQIFPAEHKGSPNEIVSVYLKDTPYLELFKAKVPFSIPVKPYRMEHTFILGGAGAGKTTLLQQLVLEDIESPMVVIDPKGEMVKRLAHLEALNNDRLIIVDPDDKPALNMFHTPERWSREYDETTRSNIESQATSNFAYIFSTIHSPLTEKQLVCFTFCVRLLFTIPGANINTLSELLEDPIKFPKDAERSARASPFFPYFEKLVRTDGTTRHFFLNNFYSNYVETRQQIMARLYGILIHPQLMAMFSAPERKLDIYDCIKNKKIVLVNGALGSPGSDASQLICRYFVALTLNAAFEHAAKDHPAHLIIDEFQLVSDEQKTPEMLRMAREYNLGITMAFQEIHGKPFNDSLRASISTNTSVKYASSPEGVDIAYVARDLRCEPEFIRAQTKTATHGRFACFVRGYLERPVSLSIPFGNIQKQPQIGDEAYRNMRERNRAKFSAPRLKEVPEAEAPPPPERRPVVESPAEEAPQSGPSPSSKRRW